MNVWYKFDQQTVLFEKSWNISTFICFSKHVSIDCLMSLECFKQVFYDCWLCLIKSSQIIQHHQISYKSMQNTMLSEWGFGKVASLFPVYVIEWGGDILVLFVLFRHGRTWTICFIYDWYMIMYELYAHTQSS